MKTTPRKSPRQSPRKSAFRLPTFAAFQAMPIEEREQVFLGWLRSKRDIECTFHDTDTCFLSRFGQELARDPEMRGAVCSFGKSDGSRWVETLVFRDWSPGPLLHATTMGEAADLMAASPHFAL